ncbi:FAD-dependent monooxygenase [Streptomyces sp. NPDC020377]|uniref:FAD-dependent monooxygenase n=1 Tax=Streptomyces sp. NPDC020377 TaxID=3365070 RepID=UPI00378E21D5
MHGLGLGLGGEPDVHSGVRRPAAAGRAAHHLNVGIVDAANVGWKLEAAVCGCGGEDILDTYTTERHPVPARLLQNTLWEPFSGLLDLDDAHRYVAGMDVRYDLGDDHRLVGTLCPDAGAARPGRRHRGDPVGGPAA